MHPEASIEYRVRQRARARVHVEPHPVLADHIQLSIVVGHRVDFELTFATDEAETLARSIAYQVDEIRDAFPDTAGGVA